MTKLPRLYVNDKFSKIIHPVSLSINENIVPLSSASITLLEDEKLPARSYLELYTPYGSAGMFRVRSPHDTYGSNTSTAELEHMVAEVGDYVVRAEYDQMMNASTAVKTVFSHYRGKRWKLGKYSDIGTGQIALECKYESVLNALLGILEQKPDCMIKFDFSTSPWTLSIVKRGTSVVAEGRLARNVTTATVTYDDSELATRVYYQTYSKDKDGNVVASWTSKDADTIKTYGVVESTVSTSSDMTSAEINATVNAYLNAHKKPRTSVQIQAIELNKITGDRRDKYVIGDLYRLALPDYSLTVELNVTSIAWADVINTPDRANVQLGEEEDTVVTFLHNMDATGSGSRGGSGGGGSKKQEEAKWKEFFTTIEQTDTDIKLTASKVDRANNILQQAGMNLNSKGVLTYAKDKENHLMSKINVQSNRIDLVVRGTGPNATINTAKIMMGINEDKSASYIKLRASRIELDGYVTMKNLEATNAEIRNLKTGATQASSLRSVTMNTSIFIMAGTNATWKTKTIAGETIHYLGY